MNRFIVWICILSISASGLSLPSEDEKAREKLNEEISRFTDRGSSFAHRIFYFLASLAIRQVAVGSKTSLDGSRFGSMIALASTLNSLASTALPFAATSEGLNPDLVEAMFVLQETIPDLCMALEGSDDDLRAQLISRLTTIEDTLSRIENGERVNEDELIKYVRKLLKCIKKFFGLKRTLEKILSDLKESGGDGFYRAMRKRRERREEAERYHLPHPPSPTGDARFERLDLVDQDDDREEKTSEESARPESVACSRSRDRVDGSIGRRSAVPAVPLDTLDDSELLAAIEEYLPNENSNRLDLMREWEAEAGFHLGREYFVGGVNYYQYWSNLGNARSRAGVHGFNKVSSELSAYTFENTYCLSVDRDRHAGVGTFKVFVQGKKGPIYLDTGILIRVRARVRARDGDDRVLILLLDRGSKSSSWTVIDPRDETIRKVVKRKDADKDSKKKMSKAKKKKAKYRKRNTRRH